MKNIILCLIIIAGTLVLSQRVTAQSDYIGLGSKQYNLLNRLDIKLKDDSVLSFSAAKPYNRKIITQRIEYIDSLYRSGALPVSLSAIDRYNMRSLLMNNAEWTKAFGDSFHVKKPLFGRFFVTPAHLYETYSKDFVLIIDPVWNLQAGKSSDVKQTLFFNTRGVAARGRVGNIGFYTYLTDNQERDPQFVQDYVDKHYGLPGAGYYKAFHNNGYDYFDARGGIDFSAGKYCTFRFGYDKLFIGDGYRSLFLSDFSNNYLYLQMDVQIRNFSYKSVYAELIAPFNPSADRDTVRYKNYMALHRLGIQVNRWLNIGLYENVLYNGRNGIELSYLNPVIFYRSIEMQLGSGNSKATVGMDIKANVTRHLQWYGQLLIGEFVLNEILHYNRHSWLNKQAVQVGGKYIDVAGIKNLDLQAEVNIVRPYVYQHNDSATTFAHYNTPLAHPAGANFKELVVIANYQPFPRVYLTGKLFGRKQGLDSAGYNMGSDIFRSYNSRPRDYGLYTGVGIPATTWLYSLAASYEIRENLFFDLGVNRRNYNVQGQPAQTATFFMVGLRRNIGRRTFEF